MRGNSYPKLWKTGFLGNVFLLLVRPARLEHFQLLLCGRQRRCGSRCVPNLLEILVLTPVCGFTVYPKP